MMNDEHHSSIAGDDGGGGDGGDDGGGGGGINVTQSIPITAALAALGGILEVFATAVLAYPAARSLEGMIWKDWQLKVCLAMNIILQILASLAGNLFATWYGPVSIVGPIFFAAQLLANLIVFWIVLGLEAFSREMQIGTYVIVISVILLILNGPRPQDYGSESENESNEYHDDEFFAIPIDPSDTSSFNDNNNKQHNVSTFQDLISEPYALIWAWILLISMILSGLIVILDDLHRRKEWFRYVTLLTARASSFSLNLSTGKAVTLPSPSPSSGQVWLIINISIKIISGIIYTRAIVVQSTAVPQRTFVPINATLIIFINAITGIIIWEDWKVIQSWIGYICVFFLLGLGCALLLGDLGLLQETAPETFRGARASMFVKKERTKLLENLKRFGHTQGQPTGLNGIGFSSNINGMAMPSSGVGVGVGSGGHRMSGGISGVTANNDTTGVASVTSEIYYNNHDTMNISSLDQHPSSLPPPPPPAFSSSPQCNGDTHIIQQPQQQQPQTNSTTPTTTTAKPSPKMTESQQQDDLFLQQQQQQQQSIQSTIPIELQQEQSSFFNIANNNFSAEPSAATNSVGDDIEIICNEFFPNHDTNNNNIHHPYHHHHYHPSSYSPMNNNNYYNNIYNINNSMLNPPNVIYPPSLQQQQQQQQILPRPTHIDHNNRQPSEGITRKSRLSLRRSNRSREAWANLYGRANAAPRLSILSIPSTTTNYYPGGVGGGVGEREGEGEGGGGGRRTSIFMQPHPIPTRYLSSTIISPSRQQSLYQYSSLLPPNHSSHSHHQHQQQQSFTNPYSMLGNSITSSGYSAILPHLYQYQQEQEQPYQRSSSNATLQQQQEQLPSVVTTHVIPCAAAAAAAAATALTHENCNDENVHPITTTSIDTTEPRTNCHHSNNSNNNNNNNTIPQSNQPRSSPTTTRFPVSLESLEEEDDFVDVTAADQDQDQAQAQQPFNSIEHEKNLDHDSSFSSNTTMSISLQGEGGEKDDDNEENNNQQQTQQAIKTTTNTPPSIDVQGDNDTDNDLRTMSTYEA